MIQAEKLQAIALVVQFSGFLSNCSTAHHMMHDESDSVSIQRIVK